MGGGRASREAGLRDYFDSALLAHAQASPPPNDGTAIRDTSWQSVAKDTPPFGRRPVGCFYGYSFVCETDPGGTRGGTRYRAGL